MQQNPFAPPSELTDVPRASAATSGSFVGVRVYSPNQVALATFLGSPIAFAWLMGANFVAFGNSGAARKAWLWGALTTAALATIGAFLPDGVPSSPVAIAYTILAKHLAVKYQARDVATVLMGGGSKYSSWRAAGLGVLSFLAVLVVVIPVLLLLHGIGVVDLE
jgi:hypothetical protein